MMAAMRTLISLLCLSLLAAPALAQKPGEDTVQSARPVEPRWQRDIRGSETQNRRQAERDERRNRRQAEIVDEVETTQTDVDVERILPFLAYTLGELHYLSYACEGIDVQTWRDHMVELLAMEASDNNRRRDQLIENFNDGYRTQQRYRPVCGPQAEAERRALAFRGRDLSEMMRSAYFD